MQWEAYPQVEEETDCEAQTYRNVRKSLNILESTSSVQSGDANAYLRDSREQLGTKCTLA